MPSILRLKTATDTISLNELVAGDSGFQALSGAIGFGLPPLDVSWAGGAGHGSSFRHSRARFRDFDLPLYLGASSRPGLKDLTDRLALALAGPVKLQWIEGGETWELDCHRVSGGDYIYGRDTGGEDDLRMVVTLRSGDPFWTNTAVRHKAVGTGQVTVDTGGTAPTPPIWTLTGPLTKFDATSPTGEHVGWTGTLGTGSTITINTKTGTALTGGGANAYGKLDRAPRMWHLPGGSSLINVTKAGTGSVDLAWNPKKWMVI